MKTFLQILALCLLIAMLFTFVVACDDKGDEPSSSSSSSSTGGSSSGGGSSEPGPIEPPDYQDPTYGLTEDLTGKNDPGDTQ